MGTRKRKRAYRHRNQPMDGNKIRVRGKRLDQIDNTKLSLAYWLLAKQLVEDRLIRGRSTRSRAVRSPTRSTTARPQTTEGRRDRLGRRLRRRRRGADGLWCAHAVAAAARRVG